MKKNKCPCEDCICIPVCKQKSFYKLFRDCIYLRIYEPAYAVTNRNDISRLQAINDILKSEAWNYVFSSSKSNYSDHVVIKIEGNING